MTATLLTLNADKVSASTSAVAEADCFLFFYDFRLCAWVA